MYGYGYSYLHQHAFGPGAGAGDGGTIEQPVEDLPDGAPVVVDDPTAPPDEPTCYTAAAVGDGATPTAPTIQAEGAPGRNKVRTTKRPGDVKVKVYKGGRSTPPEPFESAESNTSCATPLPADFTTAGWAAIARPATSTRTYPLYALLQSYVPYAFAAAVRPATSVYGYALYDLLQPVPFTTFHGLGRPATDAQTFALYALLQHYVPNAFTTAERPATTVYTFAP